MPARRRKLEKGERAQLPARLERAIETMGAPMIELLLVACLADDPSRCKDVGLAYSGEGLTPMQCLMQAQPEIARWVEEHPRWQVRRWSGRPAGQLAKT